MGLDRTVNDLPLTTAKAALVPGNSALGADEGLCFPRAFPLLQTELLLYRLKARTIGSFSSK